FKELSARAPILLRHLNPHQPEREELINQFMLKYAFLVHFPDLGPQGLVGKLAYVVAKQVFIVGKRHEWLRRRGKLGGNLGHRCILLKDSGKLKIVSSPVWMSAAGQELVASHLTHSTS